MNLSGSIIYYLTDHIEKHFSMNVLIDYKFNIMAPRRLFKRLIIIIIIIIIIVYSTFLQHKLNYKVGHKIITYKYLGIMTRKYNC